MTTLIRANCELLQQGADLLARHDDHTFVAADAASYGAGIGLHLRHVLDHYRSFLAGVRTGMIDYGDRQRETAVERDRLAALDAIVSAKEALAQVAVPAGERARVKASDSTESEEIWSESSFGRELQFLVSHTVHHYALMAIASRMQGVLPGANFGVAPSTLKHLRAARA